MTQRQLVGLGVYIFEIGLMPTDGLRNFKAKN